MLGVQTDKNLAKLLGECLVNEGAVDSKARGGFAYFSCYDKLRFAVEKLLLFEPGGNLRSKMKDAFDLGLVRSGSNQRRTCLCSEQDAQGVNQNRFAGAGLAGQNVQSSLQADLEFLDEGEVFY